MKQSIHNILKRLYYLLLIICGLGLVLALVGLSFKYDPLYFMGLILASPLFLIVLPACFLMIILFYFGCIYGIISWLKKVSKKTKLTTKQQLKHYKFIAFIVF